MLLLPGGTLGKCLLGGTGEGPCERTSSREELQQKHYICQRLFHWELWMLDITLIKNQTICQPLQWGMCTYINDSACTTSKFQWVGVIQSVKVLEDELKNHKFNHGKTFVQWYGHTTITDSKCPDNPFSSHLWKTKCRYDWQGQSAINIITALFLIFLILKFTSDLELGLQCTRARGLTHWYSGPSDCLIAPTILLLTSFCT